jgi:hypothetical protein
MFNPPRTLVIAAMLAVATPASAGLYQYSYTGTVEAEWDPALSNGVVVGDTAHVIVRYDPAALIDITAAANALYGTAYTDLKGATLTDLWVTLGPTSFTAANHFPLFPDPGVVQPAVLFNNGAFFGIAYFGVDFIANATFVTAGAAPETFDFVGGNFIGAAGPSFGGHFDYAKAVGTAVPEPASWALMVAGFALTGAALRRRGDIRFTV